MRVQQRVRRPKRAVATGKTVTSKTVTSKNRSHYSLLVDALSRLNQASHT